MKMVVDALAILTIAFVLSIILAVPVMWLWDWLMPTLFGLKEITLMQSWGLLLLCGMLFKSHTYTSK